MKKTVKINTCTPRFHGTFSNAKLGGKNQKIMAVSYAPGAGYIHLKNGALVADCLGTCGAVDCKECSKACYAIRSYRQYPAVTVNCVENTMQLREDPAQHFKDIKAAAIANNIETIRYTASGEIENRVHFDYLVNLAVDLPNIQIYLYTKNYEVLRAYFESGRELPENMTVLISTWGRQGVEEYREFSTHNNIKCFAVNPDGITPQVYCPAYKEVNGKVKLNKDMTCAKCGLCTGKSKAKIIGCLEH